MGYPIHEDSKYQWKNFHRLPFKVAKLQSRINKSMDGHQTLSAWFFSFVVQPKFVGLCLFGWKTGFNRKLQETTKFRYQVLNKIDNGPCLVIRAACKVIRSDIKMEDYLYDLGLDQIQKPQ